MSFSELPFSKRKERAVISAQSTRAHIAPVTRKCFELPLAAAKPQKNAVIATVAPAAAETKDAGSLLLISKSGISRIHIANTEIPVITILKK